MGGQEQSSVPSTCCICHFLLLAENCLVPQLDQIDGYSICFVVTKFGLTSRYKCTSDRSVCQIFCLALTLYHLVGRLRVFLP